MKIAQVNKLYFPAVGGIEQVVRDIAEGVIEYGHESDVLCSVPRGVGRSETLSDVRVTRASSLGTSLSVPLAPTFPYHLRQAHNSHDVVHYHLPNPLAVASDFFVGNSRAPTVVTYHSDIVRQARSLQFYRPLLHEFLSKAERIIVTSPPLLQNSRELQNHKSKCTVIPLSINIDDYPSPTPVNFTLSERPTLLFVGRLNYYKGVEVLIEAVRPLNVELLIVGDGPRRDSLEELAQSTNTNAHIRFYGYVSDDELGEYYKNSDIFVFPSIEPSEAFGIVQLEAMAHGLPVINTALPTGVPWVSPHGKTGLTVPPGEVEPLRQAISQLTSNVDYQAELGQKARERVEKHFDKKQMIESTLNVYRSLY
ncbi:glycosyltransferase [Haladaptatus sp. ZSTT2]|uniref:glycosyltransferase n=1 Tax=Haladaptatus sp. ZSTT2 TaxID=3120515 RepID=UPI00300EECA6